MILSIIVLVGLLLTFRQWFLGVLTLAIGSVCIPFAPFVVAFKTKNTNPKAAKAFLFSGCCFALAISLYLLFRLF